MDYNINEVSLYQVLIYLLFGLLSAVVAYIITNYLLPMLSRRKYSRMQIWEKVQITFWIIYAGLLFIILFRLNMFVTIALSIVIFGAGWNFWRNVFSGIVIKLSTQFTIGEAIDIEFAKGELKTIGMSRSELINEIGETVVIPNYKLRNSVFRHLNKETNVHAHSFVVNVSAGKTIASVYNIALECPFVSANQKVEVERTGPNELVVRASVIDNTFIDQVNTYLHEFCGKDVVD